ncbi:heavy metal-associated isoprenylated plant protein 1 isoform X2 [Diospyros lotus]|uniref:heavy metal-associated isoprenylated plant protein 1 isoform X2 n=1 Tax=Diospyros lotus TaxID=55363 RepID=UPI0022516DC8|nr:heavy metal-associated isoprenylated plant protein 1 isoform X2 [Diospyros lotus]
MSEFLIKYCCMVMRINVDCSGCCRKLQRIILNTKEIEMHSIEKQHRRVSVCGRFRASDVAIRIRKKMNRRVEILEIQELEAMNVNAEQTPETTEEVFQQSACQVFQERG